MSKRKQVHDDTEADTRDCLIVMLRALVMTVTTTPRGGQADSICKLPTLSLFLAMNDRRLAVEFPQRMLARLQCRSAGFTCRLRLMWNMKSFHNFIHVTDIPKSLHSSIIDSASHSVLGDCVVHSAWKSI